MDQNGQKSPVDLSHRGKSSQRKKVTSRCISFNTWDFIFKTNFKLAPMFNLYISQYLDIDGRIILKWNLSEQDTGAWKEFFWSSIGIIDGYQ
jgi:hypothetical protein